MFYVSIYEWKEKVSQIPRTSDCDWVVEEVLPVDISEKVIPVYGYGVGDFYFLCSRDHAGLPGQLHNSLQREPACGKKNSCHAC